MLGSLLGSIGSAIVGGLGGMFGKSRVGTAMGGPDVMRGYGEQIGAQLPTLFGLDLAGERGRAAHRFMQAAHPGTDVWSRLNAGGEIGRASCRERV